MQKDLADFLDQGKYLCETSVSWGTELPLKITYCLNDKLPPLKYISSVRAIVFQGQKVIVVANHQGEKYILPGGRVEEGESPLDTLHREVLEETGWAIKETGLLGFMYFHHLAEKPAGYRYPYPDFIWSIYTAEAVRFDDSAIQPDDYVRESRFRNIDEVAALALEEGQLLLLDAALRLRS